MQKIDKVLNSLEKYIGGFGILFITLLVAGGVICRHLLGVTFSWVEEMSQYAMVWIAFIGAVLCVSGNDHVGIDLVFTILPKKYHAWYRIIINIFSGVFLLWFTYIAYTYTVTTFEAQSVSASMTWMPRAVLYLSAIPGGLLMGVEYIKLACSLIKKLKNNDGSLIEEEPELKEHI